MGSQPSKEVTELKENVEKLKKTIESIRQDNEKSQSEAIKYSKEVDILKRENVDIDDLRKELAAQDLNIGGKSAYVTLFGPTGVGKSSLITSIQKTMNVNRERAVYPQVSPRGFVGGGYTIYREKVPISGTNLVFVDVRGTENWSDTAMHKEAAEIMEGNRGYGKESATEISNGDKIYCGVIVLNAENPIPRTMPDFLKMMYSFQGRYPPAVVTHKNKASSRQVEEICTTLGIIGVCDVFVVQNATPKEPDVQNETKKELLNFLDSCISNGIASFKFRNEVCE